MKEVAKRDRVANFMVDTSIITLIAAIIIAIFGAHVYSNIIIYLFGFLYYFIFELLTGQTIGKMTTGTKVVKIKDSYNTTSRIFFRSLLRFIPLDGISYLYGQEQGMHDLLSGTKLIKMD